MSALHWFEIPVEDIQRAAAFYERLLGASIRVLDLTEQLGSMIGMLPDRGGVGGALVQNSQHGYVPSSTGTLVYLVVDGDLDQALERASAAGGQVLLPKTPLGADSGGGFTAWVADSEGNRVGVFSSE
jgi:predicted enzyme related to lactoylglutathione lyase